MRDFMETTVNVFDNYISIRHFVAIIYKQSLT